MRCCWNFECYGFQTWVYSIGLAKGVLLILGYWCLLHLNSWLFLRWVSSFIVLLCAYHFHGRMSQWQIFVSLWLTIVHSESELCLLIHHCRTSVTCLVYITLVLLILTYHWLGSCTMLEWYLGLNLIESPSFDFRESDQVDVHVLCLYTWIFAVCLFFYRFLVNLPKEKRL